MVRERHGLRPLEMGVAGDEDFAVGLRRRENRPAGFADSRQQVRTGLPKKQTHIQRHLVVAAAGRVELGCRRHPLRERLLDVHVDVLEPGIPRELPCLDFPLQFVQTRSNCVPFRRRDQPDVRQHRRMRLAPLDVKPGEPPVKRDGLAELQHQRGGLSGKTSAPGGLNFLRHRCGPSSAGPRPGQLESAPQILRAVTRNPATFSRLGGVLVCSDPVLKDGLPIHPGFPEWWHGAHCDSLVWRPHGGDYPRRGRTSRGLSEGTGHRFWPFLGSDSGTFRYVDLRRQRQSIHAAVCPARQRLPL